MLPELQRGTRGSPRTVESTEEEEEKKGGKDALEKIGARHSHCAAAGQGREGENSHQLSLY